MGPFVNCITSTATCNQSQRREMHWHHVTRHENDSPKCGISHDARQRALPNPHLRPILTRWSLQLWVHRGSAGAAASSLLTAGRVHALPEAPSDRALSSATLLRIAAEISPSVPANLPHYSTDKTKTRSCWNRNFTPSAVSSFHRAGGDPERIQLSGAIVFPTGKLV